MFVIIVIGAYFIDISQGSVEMHLRCGGICNQHAIANCPQSVPVKIFFWKIKSIIGKDMDKSTVSRFFGPPRSSRHISGPFIAVATHIADQTTKQVKPYKNLRFRLQLAKK